MIVKADIRKHSYKFSALYQKNKNKNWTQENFLVNQ